MIAGTTRVRVNDVGSAERVTAAFAGFHVIATTLRKYSVAINPVITLSARWCLTRPRIASILLKEIAAVSMNIHR